MPAELDHFFICTACGAPEADRLIAFGLTEGSPNRHPGQGTANRRFFFDNAFLELLWVDDPREAQSDLVRHTGLYERWSGRATSASSFGVGLRPIPGTASDIPFPAWPYRPPYLPEPLAIHMADNSTTVTEPLLFYLGFARRPDLTDPSRRQPRDHRAGLRTVSWLHISGPQETVSRELRLAEQQCQGLRFIPRSDYLLEAGFDGEIQGKTVDFRPTLPVILRW